MDIKLTTMSLLAVSLLMFATASCTSTSKVANDPSQPVAENAGQKSVDSSSGKSANSEQQVTDASERKVAIEPEQKEERVCFNSNNVRGYTVLDDRYVYVSERRNKHYLLTMQTRCTNLDGAFGIAISDTTSRVCSRGFGKIIYQDRLSGREVESCRIREIERVDDKEHAKRIVAARTGPPPEEQGTWSDIPPEDPE